MRRPFRPALLALLLLAACSTPSTPVDVSVNGHWTSVGIDTVKIQMTMSETARTINGAGSWVTPTRAVAFRVSGAHISQSISLLFDFVGDHPAVNFHGEFLTTARDSLTMTGQLDGGSYRGTSVVLVRTIEQQ
jgi:hypothetical protein